MGAVCGWDDDVHAFGVDSVIVVRIIDGRECVCVASMCRRTCLTEETNVHGPINNLSISIGV